MKKKAVGKMAAIVLGGFTGLFILVIVVLLFVSGAFEAPQYLAPWEKSYAREFADPRIRLAANGLLAASNHNMQPWKIKLDENNPMVLYLYADSKRMTVNVDPYSRQMMISQGTFLEYVKIAGDEIGYRTNIDLFPAGSYDEANLIHSMDTKPVAKVTLTKTQPRPNAFYDGIFLPDTNREAYQATKLTSTQREALTASNPERGIDVKIYQDSNNLHKISEYAQHSAVIEAGVPRVMQEAGDIFRANEYQKNKYRYGYSVEGQGTSGLMKHLMQGLVTIFPSLNTGKAAANNFIQSTRTSVENTPAYGMIVSDNNSRLAQVQSGMVYSRLVLVAHQLGLVMQPLSQALEEYPEMKSQYDGITHDYAGNGETIQMLFRLGRPTQEVPLSMRRDVREIID